ncbi:topoisomerase DNA-binding C4 zinc finger domain-containing protein [Desulfosporosinus metallidurans]|nr:topoisomerase DNA-binding C4 zinc finger domain-containing protein [Desulfosporosinus metallidurans]
MPVVHNNNDTVLCPKCGLTMVLRKANKGQNAEKEFYGCPNYPQLKKLLIKMVRIRFVQN